MGPRRAFDRPAWDDPDARPELLLRYLDQIRLQASIAAWALDHIGDAGKRQDTVALWGGLQAFIGAQGCLSLLLWPDSRGLKERGRAMRALLSVGDDSPLRDRSARNDLYHLDERMDRWARQSRNRDSVTASVEHLSAVLDAGIELGDVLSLFDPQRGSVVLAGTEHPILPLRGALIAVLERLPSAYSALEREIRQR